MRLPFIQVTQEAWDYARQLAALADIGVGDAFFIVTNLWRWGIGLGPDTEAPTGLCVSPRAPVLLKAAVEVWTGTPDRLVEHLVDLELVELLDGGLRVRGMQRYAAAWEKARKDRARKAALKAGTPPLFRATSAGIPPEGARNSAGTPGEDQGQTQTQTQMKEDHVRSRREADGGGGESERGRRLATCGKPPEPVGNLLKPPDGSEGATVRPPRRFPRIVDAPEDPPPIAERQQALTDPPGAPA